ncbi:hypothetical protein TNCV_887441 [Trichonephila clavipes]|uniref:Uncharacterized protein n=1 Tax=Trichonephila clavipes TaxID=2585209 RepID=A0A8X6URV6_TRICX|nr:hypothetical protein TNCV_887441 [Trichonephila clavipes]
MTISFRKILPKEQQARSFELECFLILNSGYVCKKKFKNRRKRTKVQKPEIEIKLAPHKPRKAAPTELTIDDEDMITYDVVEEEIEPDHAGNFTIKEDPLNFPKGYLRSLTPS